MTRIAEFAPTAALIPRSSGPDDARSAEANDVGSASWQKESGERFDAGLSPASVFFDAVLSEIDRRQAAGQPLDLQTFRAVCPELAESLDRLLEVRQLLEDHPALDTESDATPWPQAGQTFLGLDLVEELGRGGAARVFLARQRSLGNRQVAVKISAKGAAEAHMLGRLEGDCEHIVRALSFEQDVVTGLNAVVMPFLGRCTLEAVCHHVRAVVDAPTRGKPGGKLGSAAELLLLAQKGAPSARGENAETPARAAVSQALSVASVFRWGTREDGILHVVRCIAEALAHAHDRGVAHLDLKPANVLLDFQGRPRLLDFNLAQSGDQQRERVGGTLPYMSPEQLAGMMRLGPRTEIGTASDVYSLGIVFHQLLTGRLPFGPIPVHCQMFGDHDQPLDPGQLIPESLRRYCPRADRGLGRLIARCLSLDPSQRPTAAEVAREVRGRLTMGRRARRFVQRNLVGLAAITASLVLLAGAAFASLPSQEEIAARRVEEAWDAGRAALRGGDPAVAVELLDRAAAESPSEEIRRWQAAARYAAGKEHFDAGRWQLALQQFDRAVRIAESASGQDDPAAASRLAVFRQGRGAARYELADFQAAQEDFRAARAISGDETLSAFEGYCALKRRQWSDAAAAYGREVAFHRDPAALNNLAFALVKSGDWTGARRHLDEAIQLDPTCRAAFYNRAMLAWSMLSGETNKITPEEALRDISQSLSLGPTNVALVYDAAVLYANASSPDQRKRCLDLLFAGIEDGQPISAVWLSQQPAVQAVFAEFGQVLPDTASQAAAGPPVDSFSLRVLEFPHSLPPLSAEFH